MDGKALKHSKQREALIEILENTKSHPSAEWLYCEMKKKFPNVSLATVYRNLNLLLSLGKVIRLDVGSGTEHYDAFTKNHYHFVCKDCGSIIDMSIPAFDELDKKAEEMDGVTVESHSLIFYGQCKSCKESERAF